ncbi:hypothetical protein [Rhodanobacter ginsengiterrae]|uniref:hypothetical protein n=1 Tax=Rhodanobacter ginsengiterrae TaxID=2008451 RepID=UPI003CEBAE56
MIELEIQGLSQSREGLLIEVGRFILASGFTLQRQRLVQDTHGILLTMVVRGPPRKQRALEAALETYDRFISFNVSPFVEGESKPHFGASAKRSTYLPPPAPEPLPIELAAQPAVVAVVAAAPQPTDGPFTVAPILTRPVGAEASPPTAAAAAPPETDFDFILPTPRAPAPAPAAAVDVQPFVETVMLGPDEAAVDQALQALEHDYPRLMPKLLALQGALAEGARESSLALAGQRVGSWVFSREYALDSGLELADALERIGTPALRALIEVDLQEAQLHLLASPLCTEGHSGCSFFSGFLEGLLGPAIAPGSLSIFPVCCRSYGADACVLAISD